MASFFSAAGARFFLTATINLWVPTALFVLAAAGKTAVALETTARTTTAAMRTRSNMLPEYCDSSSGSLTESLTRCVHPYGQLALGVRCRERGECVRRFRELVGRVDRDAQTIRQEVGEPLEVLRRRCGHDHRPSGTFARGAGRRRDAAAVLDEGSRSGGSVVDQIEHRVEPVGIPLACYCLEVPLAGQQIAD